MTAIDFIEKLPCYTALINSGDIEPFLVELHHLLGADRMSDAIAISVMERVNIAWEGYVSRGGEPRSFDFTCAVREVISI